MLVAALLLALVVALLTVGVMEISWVPRMDHQITDTVLTHRTHFLNAVFPVVSTLGDMLAMWILAVVVCVALVVVRRWLEAVALVVVTGASSAVGQVMKYAIGRQRPPLADRLVTAHAPSFPSGHSLGSAAVVGFVAALVVLGSSRIAIRTAAVIVACVFVVLVGCSRVYLGVHWTTDVVAGWLTGSCLVLLGVWGLGYAASRLPAYGERPAAPTVPLTSV